MPSQIAQWKNLMLAQELHQLVQRYGSPVLIAYVASLTAASETPQEDDRPELLRQLFRKDDTIKFLQQEAASRQTEIELLKIQSSALTAAEGPQSVLAEVIRWAESKCPCEDGLPNPCTLCGATAEEWCRAADQTFPSDLLTRMRAASAPPVVTEGPPSRAEERLAPGSKVQGSGIKERP